MNYEGAMAAPGAAPQATSTGTKLQQAMLWVLAFFLFILPLEEAPKNIAVVLFTALWLGYAGVGRTIGGPWNRYDTVFAVSLVTSVVSGLYGYPESLGSVFRVFLFSWLVSRSPLVEGDVRRRLVIPCCAGLLVGVPFALIPLIRGAREFLELPSVGQVNQSALYLAILAAAASGWWFQRARTAKRSWARTALAGCALVFWAALLVSASRGAIVAAAAAVGIIGLVIACCGWHGEMRNTLTRSGIAVLALAAMVAALSHWAPQLSDRKLAPDRILATYSMDHRIKHWRIAYEGWQRRPWLGWGPESFQRLTVDEVCAWRAERGQGCDRDLYDPTKHAHSLYMATLSERGLVGMAALVLLLSIWAWSLVVSARTASSCLLWPASAAGLVVVVIGGVFNTTLRVEHGSLALIFFALWIAANGRLRRGNS